MTTKWFSRDDGFTERDLLLFGFDHLASASLLFTKGGPGQLDSAGYLCHLGFELILKAVLLSISNQFPDDHSLPNLVGRIEAAGWTLQLKPEQGNFLENLNQYYELRYPNRESPISIASTDLPDLLGLQDHIVSVMPDQLRVVFDSLNKPDEDGRFFKGGRVAMIKENDSSD